MRGPARSRGEVRHLADVSRAEAELGFCPGTDLEAGLRLCVEPYAKWRDALPDLPAAVPAENPGRA